MCMGAEWDRNSAKAFSFLNTRCDFLTGGGNFSTIYKMFHFVESVGRREGQRTKRATYSIASAGKFFIAMHSDKSCANPNLGQTA
jgi:hypothetical protein